MKKRRSEGKQGEEEVKRFGLSTLAWKPIKDDC